MQANLNFVPICKQKFGIILAMITYC